MWNDLCDTETDESSIAHLPNPPPSPTAASIDQRAPIQIPNTSRAEVPPNNTRQEPVKIRIPRPFIPVTRPISTISPPVLPLLSQAASNQPGPASVTETMPDEVTQIDPVLVTISEAEANVEPNVHPTSSKRQIPMRANNSLSARNLFAIDYLKEHPNITREDFSIVWDTLEPETITVAVQTNGTRREKGQERQERQEITMHSHAFTVSRLATLDALKRGGGPGQEPSQPSREDSNNASRLSTPLQRIKLRSDSRPPTPGSCQPTVAHAHALHPKQPVRTRQQLYDRLALIDRSVAHSQDAHFRHHLLRVSESQDTCDRLLSRIDQVDTAVASMLDKRKSVEDGGKCLQNASQKLLAKQDQLVELQTAIGMTLEYLLSVTGARDAAAQSPWRVARSPDRMVERVDICIEFLKPHRNYKEAEVYLLRFQQCMTCAMTFIKMYFVGSLRALTQDVSRRLFEQDVTDTAQMHLLYTRFTTVAGQLAPLLGEFERRAHSHPEELGALLSECHGAYFGARKNLLVSRLTEQIRGLDPTRTELVELHREAGTLPLEDEIEENEKSDDLGRLHIRHLLQMILQDAQTRLFFKAQAVIQSDILQWPKIWRTQISLLPTIFYDLAHKAVSLCHGSLLSAAGLVRAKSGFDGQLFLFRHLLILKEITRNLDVAQKEEPQVGVGGGTADQYGVADILSSVLSRTSTLLPGSLFTSLAGMRRTPRG
ncbi:Sec34-like family-domain-containing protein [Lactifluus volemus]|nr:Sec34-like family-domain-containing protein [Lactifluus volemus]